VSPASGTTGGGTAVTITGTNLGGATVSFGGAAGKITADSGTQITVTSPAGQGSVTITVTTPGGSASAGKFTYVTPAPAVTGLSPSSGTTAGGTAVTITGTNLGSATGVSFGGAAGKITADSGSQVTVTSPPGTAGTVSVTVTTPGGTSSSKFTYVIPAPAVTGVSPSSGTTAGGTAVTITGTNLGGATGVSFGGDAAKIAADSGSQVTVTSPPGSAGTVSVTVTTPGGSSSGKFTYVIPAPAVSAISPSSGSTQGGTTVAISGTNLAGATSVTFGGVAAKIAADSATQITVTSPPGTSGTVTVTVTTPGGTASASFTYMPPAIT
jgi:hypothetical protein